jgi:LPS O-antigen subunit length determinant protein (WzzB/FepE family)
LNNNYDDEIDLRELFHVLWDKIFYIGAITSIFSLISIIYALMLPNIYQSQATMMPMEEDAGMSGMLGQYSGMASLAGISLPSESGSKAQEAIARIQSFEFFSNYFLPQIKLENLMAVKKWNQASNTLTYDESAFNSESSQWVRKVSPPKSSIPSSQEAYKNTKKS